MPKASVAGLFLGALLALGSFWSPAGAASVKPIKENGSDTAIVFVHGLEGSADNSFTNETLEPPLSWADLISADERALLQMPSLTRSLSQFDLYAVDYSDVFTDTRVDVSVEHMAQQVANAIDAHGLLREHKHVWFIAHSLGGIVTKRMLIKWAGAGYNRYLHHVLGVTLLGVPSNGAPLANVADTAFGRLVAAWWGINARHVSDLKTASTTNTFLQGLENDWAVFFAKRERDLLGFPKISCGFETAWEYHIGLRPLRTTIRIVPEIYTKTSCDGESSPINKTHTDLPKPVGRSDPIEDWLYNVVRLAFVRKQDVGQEFRDASRAGALDDLIDTINQGHRRTDSTGMPLIDEHVEVIAGRDLLSGLKLKSPRYTGASWADLLERVSEDNVCVAVEIEDPSRRKVRMAVANVTACLSAGDITSYACDIAYC